MVKQLDIYIDESGDHSPYTEENPLFSIAFVMVENIEDSKYPLNLFKSNLSRNNGGDHFVHVGNLVRAEKPYETLLREERQKLFYALFLLAKNAKYKVAISNVIKKGHDNDLDEAMSDSIFNMMIDCDNYFNRFDKIVLHYDNGQDTLRGLFLSSFRNRYRNVTIEKTLQQDNPFMQVADLFSYLELLKHKMKLSNLSKSEIAFFGQKRQIRKNYLQQLENKYLQ